MARLRGRKAPISPGKSMKPERIRRIRRRLGETQGAFGKRFGVPQNTVSRWEDVGLPTGGVFILVAAEIRRLEAEVRQQNGAQNGEPVRGAVA